MKMDLRLILSHQVNAELDPSILASEGCNKTWCDLGHKAVEHLSAESFFLFKKHWAMLWDSVTCRDTDWTDLLMWVGGKKGKFYKRQGC